MIWLTWRQFRVQALSVLGGIVVLTIGLALTGPHLSDLYDGSGLATCGGDCESAADTFLAQATQGASGILYWVGGGAVLLMPVLIGAFWGAPLVAREVESGTHRLVWNQSVTRARWLTVKLGGVGLLTVTAAALLSTAVTWWSHWIDDAYDNRLLPEAFSARGLVPVGYAAFAFVAGVAVGAVLRRVVPAMAVTAVVVVAAQLIMPLWAREHLATPVTVTRPLKLDGPVMMSLNGNEMKVIREFQEPGAWTISNVTIKQDGSEFTGPRNRACEPGGGREKCDAWLASFHLRQRVTYMPADRFWTLQWRETGLFVALTALLLAFSFWWVLRRLR